MDDAGNLWVGEIGDNACIRSSIAVYVLPEPDPKTTKEAEAVRYTCKYADISHNAEGMFVQEGRLYVVTKVPSPWLCGGSSSPVAITPLYSRAEVGLRISSRHVRIGRGPPSGKSKRWALTDTTSC